MVLIFQAMTIIITIITVKRKAGKRMLDFHSHILPGLDDGAKDMNTAIEMAKIAVEDGIKEIVATPHFIEGSMESHKDVILEKVRDCQKVFDDGYIPLKVIAGAEVYLTPDITDMLAKGQLMTINNGGKYILVELPMNSVPMYTEDIFFEIKLKGVTPIIAHPERNIVLASKPERLLNFVNCGCLLQINAGSITGLYGSKVKNTAELFVKNDLIHLIGSDAHSAGGRAPTIKTAITQIEKLNHGKAKEITIIGQMVLAGEEFIPSLPPRVAGFKNTWHKLKHLFG